MKFYTLNNNVIIPSLGLGTYKIIDYQEVKKAIFTALETGYRLIDTAEMYNNEFQIGKAIKEFGINRNEIFITTKIWDSSISYDYTIKSFESSLERLKTDYIDLYLIHWPRGYSFLETWKAMEDLYKDGRIRAIGVSNFDIEHLEFLMQNAEILPAVNQIEIHPYFAPLKLIDYCKSKNIIVESWSPLAKGRVVSDPVITNIAHKYNKTAAQITIRWHLENDFVVIPKSSEYQRIIENFNIFDFQLYKEDMQRINKLNSLLRMGPDPHNFLI